MSKEFAVLIGRFSPLHLGHEAVIERMVSLYGLDKVLVVIGSAGSELTEQTPFSDQERRQMLERRYPKLQTALLPDFPTDSQWLEQLDQVISRLYPTLEMVEFWGGSTNDLEVLIEAGRRVRIIDRFDGTTPVLSATEVREALRTGKSLQGYVDPLLIPYITKLFNKRPTSR